MITTQPTRQPTTRDEIRQHLDDLCRQEVAAQVNDDIEISDGDDSVECGGFISGGRFEYIEGQRVTLMLEDEAAKGFYVESPGLFSGMTDQGLEWEASVRRHVRTGRTLKLVLDVRQA
jgi:hypothetical protein